MVTRSFISVVDGTGDKTQPLLSKKELKEDTSGFLRSVEKERAWRFGREEPSSGVSENRLYGR